MEKGLEHYQSTQSLTFDRYIYYLQKEVRGHLKVNVDKLCFNKIGQMLVLSLVAGKNNIGNA